MNDNVKYKLDGKTISLVVTLSDVERENITSLPNSRKGGTMSDKILITFKDDLSAISFTVDGKVIDPRAVLLGLFTGQLQVMYDEKWIEPDPQNGRMQRHLKSQTFEVVPANK